MSDDCHDIMYLRLSKEDGDIEDGSVEESCSIVSQRLCIQRYIKKSFSKAASFEEIVDDGFSGTNMNRPGIQKLLRLVNAGKVRTIIVRDLSRFARNYLEAGHYLEFVFPIYNVRFISINDSFDSDVVGESTGGLELAIRNLINELYSKDISRKIKSVVDLKKLNGEYVYGSAPYGYKKGPTKNTIIPDDSAAQIVRRIFILAAGGETITQIAKRLNEEQVTTPSVYLASVRGKYKTRAFWTFESIRNILTNRIYTGDTEPFKSHVIRVGSDRVKPIPAELRQVIPCTHEGLVSRELFFQAQNTIKTVKKSKASADQNPLTSLLVCGCCGNRLSKGKASNKDWLCASARYQKELECGLVRVNDQKMKTILLRAIALQCELLDERIRKLSQGVTSQKDKSQLLQDEIRRFQRQIERSQSKKMCLYEDYVSGTISKEAYIAQKKELVADEEGIKAQLQISQHQLKELECSSAIIKAQVEESERFVSLSEMKELTPQLVKEMISRVVVYPTGSIKIEWNFRDEIARVVELDQAVNMEIAM